MRRPGTPVWLRLVARLVPPGHRDPFLGDLLEEYEEHVRPSRSRGRALLWLVGMAVGGALVALGHRAFDGARRTVAKITGAGRAPPGAAGRGGMGMERWWMDLRYALRHLARSPLFTLVAVASLAVGIGANTAIFSVANALLFDRPDVRDPDRVVQVYTTVPTEDVAAGATSWATWPDLAALDRAFEDVVGYAMFFGSARVGERPEMVLGEIVTANYFEGLGVPVVLGRGFVPEEDVVPGRDPVAVLSHSFWRERYGADPDVLGSRIRLNGRPYTVVGVAGRDFGGMTPGLAAQLWVPRMMAGHLTGPGTGDGVLTDRRREAMSVKARLAPGTTVERARAALDALASRLRERHPEAYEAHGFRAVPMEDLAIHPAVDRAVVPVTGLLMGVTVLILVIACANLAGFLLARGADRRKEIAVRLALGAGRGRLVQQLLTETMVLALLGGAVGVGLAHMALGAVGRFEPPMAVPISIDVAPDGTVLAFALGVSVVTGLLFGLLPAVQSTRPEVAPTLKDDAGVSGGDGGPGRLRSGLLVAQVTISLVLMVAGGLFLRSLAATAEVDPGFETRNGALVTVEFSSSGYGRTEALAAVDEIRSRAEARPEIAGVAVTSHLPLDVVVQEAEVEVAGVGDPEGAQSYAVDVFDVSPRYLDVLGVRLLEGRGLGTEDGPGALDVAVVSESFARRFWPDGPALGRTFRQDGTEVTVVGVASDLKVRKLGEGPRPHFYRPVAQDYPSLLVFVAEGTRSEAATLRALSATVRSYDEDILVTSTRTMSEHFDFMLMGPRAAAALLGAAGFMALLLAAVGLFGTVSYAVARRTREVGIRMSLGATRGEVVGLLMRRGMGLVGWGCAVGLVFAWAGSRAAESYLYGVSATDPVTFLGVPLLLLGVSALAAWLPARRASRVDPCETLRLE